MINLKQLGFLTVVLIIINAAVIVLDLNKTIIAATFGGIILLGTIVWIEYKQKVSFDGFPKELRKIARQLSENGNTTVSKNEIYAIAENPLFRMSLFNILNNHNKQHLFPNDFLSEEAKSEAVLYAVLRNGFGSPDIVDFKITERVEKEITVHNETIEVYYLVGQFILKDEEQEQVFVTGPTFWGRFDYPLDCLTSLDFEYVPEPSDLVEKIHTKFLLLKQ